MKQILLIFTFVFIIKTNEATECQVCVDRSHYQKCESTIDKLTGTPIACPGGEICDHSSGTATCKSSQLLLEFSVTAAGEPACSGPSKLPALLCYQYYQCIPMWWWWTPELKTCPNGKAFDPSQSDCTCAGRVKCILPDTEAKCDGPGSFASLSCKEYYECSRFLWWWQKNLKTCPEGQSYDARTCTCAEDSLVECTLPEPKCYGWAKYPAIEKNQYYECVLNGDGTNWEPQLKTCETPGWIYVVKYGTCKPGINGIF